MLGCNHAVRAPLRDRALVEKVSVNNYTRHFVGYAHQIINLLHWLFSSTGISG
jgi:hypothetical protein